MPGQLRTQRWCDPAGSEDGYRVLVCRYRPRALPKAQETWNVWMRDLGPSPALFDAFFGKSGAPPLTLAEYLRRYREELDGEAARACLESLVHRLRAGETVTLLCSRDCILPAACHRTALAAHLEALLHGEAPPLPGK